MSFSNGVERTMPDQFGDKTLMESLKPILRSKTFSGRSISWPSEGRHKYGYWTYSVIDLVITILTVSYSLHCTHFFFHSPLNTGQILIGLVLTFYYMGASLLCCINIIASFISGRDFMKEVQDYHVLSGRDAFDCLVKINYWLLWVFILALLVVIILISTMFVASVFPKESVLVRMLMFSHSEDLEFSVGVVSFALVSFFIGSGQLGDFWMLTFFCQVFRLEFRHLRNKWLAPRCNSSNDSGNHWYENIDTFRKEYEQVVKLVNAVERAFRFDLLLYFGVIIPVTCVFIYATLQPQDIEGADLVVIQIMACVTAVECCFIIIVGVKITTVAHELKEDLYNVDMTNMPSDVISKLSIFLTRLTASPIGISVAGLFIIDNSTILMLAGTLLTYVVVVIQTKPSNNKFRLPGPENCTFI